MLPALHKWRDRLVGSFPDRLPPMVAAGLRVDLSLVEGEERTSGLPLSIASLRGAKTGSSLLDTVFGGTFRERSLGRFWLWQLARALSATAADCSLVVLELADPYLAIRAVEVIGS